MYLIGKCICILCLILKWERLRIWYRIWDGDFWINKKDVFMNRFNYIGMLVYVVLFMSSCDDSFDVSFKVDGVLVVF